MLDPLGAVFTLVGLVGLVAGILKTTGVLAIVGADPVGVGLILVSLLLLAVGITRGRPGLGVTDVRADIQHRKGCPRNPARMETWKDVREDTGIEYVVGKCNDCGAMAYRHGDVPVNPPRRAAPAEPRPPLEKIAERPMLVEGFAGPGRDPAAAPSEEQPGDADDAEWPPPPVIVPPGAGEPPTPPRDPRDALAEKLSRLYREGHRLKWALVLAIPPAGAEAVTGDTPVTRIQCDELTRRWDGQVTAALFDYGGTLWSKWEACARLRAAHPTLRHIEPATTLQELRDFVNVKHACLREIIAELGGGEAPPDPDPPPTRQREGDAEDAPTPIERLQTQLDKAMTLRGVVARGVPQHWEGDALVPDDPEDEVKLDKLVYAWFKATYDLLRKSPFTRHAEDFWGPAFRGLERSYLNTVYGAERDRLGGHDQLLNDRIELIKRILKEHGG
ncbi:MAG TPA: hypothetical protein VJT75_11470 [Thermoleophilaceae bacterium]|nr:hypothetical protein [Thermoleophilaceae bacterium]